MKKQKMAIGIDIGGTNTKIGFIDQQGNLLHHFIHSTLKDIPSDEYLKILFNEIENCLETLPSLNSYVIQGLGIGAPMANFDTGCIDYAPNLNWKNVPLKKQFEDIFKLNAFVENDANLAALGEKAWGAGKDLDHFIMITLGTGVGTGLILNGNLYRGNKSLGAEGGHVLIPHSKVRKCSCGGVNHLESYLSAKGIKQTIKEMTDEDWSLETFIVYFHKNDPRALEIVNNLSEELARGLETMSVLLAPQAFLIGGGVSKLGLHFLELVEKKLNTIIHYSLKNQIKILPSALSSDKGAIYGGAALVFKELKA
jgi:glucokinase